MKELRVAMRFAPDDVRAVGVLAEAEGRVWFQFDPDFRGPEVSPVRLPVAVRTLIEHGPKPGVPLPGVFNDARPEGWGLKLLHRAFQGRGRPVSSVSALDELASLGPTAMGALTFEPSTASAGSFDDAVALSDLARHASRVFDDRVEDVLPALVRAGGPSGGARPKALIALPEGGGPGVHLGEGHIPDGFGGWLVKFPTSSDDGDVGRREAAWSSLARAAGLEVAEARVLALDGVGAAFATRRFDRGPGDTRRHVLSAAGALDVDFRSPAADYRHLLRLAQVVCAGDASQVSAMFRLAVFNVATRNEDDHLRNVAFLLDPAGRWRLAPAYDLTYSPRPDGERWVTVNGVGRGVSRADLLAIGIEAGLRKGAAERVIDEVVTAALDIEGHLTQFGCANAVSAAAADVVTATANALRGVRRP